MKSLLKHFQDARLWIPLLFLLSFELVLQSGVYARYLLEPESYAENVSRVVRTVKESPLPANALVIGTSVPYQGFLMPRLNAGLENTGLVVQSAACQGAMIETQYSIFRAVAPELPGLKVILYVADPALAWKTRYYIEKSNLSMVAQFPRWETVQLLEDMRYELRPQDQAYIWVRSLTYQQDIRNFVLSPLNRIKRIGNRLDHMTHLYPYENEHQFSMAAFEATDLRRCIENASQPSEGSGEFIYDQAGHKISDRHHRNSVLQTCVMADLEIYLDSLPPRTQWRDLYFERLGMLFDEMHARGYRIVTIFPPYSNLIDPLNDDERISEWRTRLREIYGENPYYELDMRRVLDGPDNASYYYDILHLNAAGAAHWTDALIGRLRPLAPALMN